MKTHLFWLSFCDPQKPPGERFLGACMVRASDLDHAMRQAALLGIPNKGEVMSGIAQGKEQEQMLGKFVLNKLYTREELNDLGEFSDYDRNRRIS